MLAFMNQGDRHLSGHGSLPMQTIITNPALLAAWGIQPNIMLPLLLRIASFGVTGTVRQVSFQTTALEPGGRPSLCGSSGDCPP